MYGLSVGYTAKQLITNDYKGPWVGGDKYWITSPALKIGLYWAPEFRYGIGGDWGLISIRKSTAARLNKPFFVTLSYVF